MNQIQSLISTGLINDVEPLIKAYIEALEDAKAQYLKYVERGEEFAARFPTCLDQQIKRFKENIESIRYNIYMAKNGLLMECYTASFKFFVMCWHEDQCIDFMFDAGKLALIDLEDAITACVQSYDFAPCGVGSVNQIFHVHLKEMD